MHNRQPTVILREFQRGEKVNAWICARRSTDHHHALEKIWIICNVCNFMRTLLFFGINKFCKNYFCNFLLKEMVFELIDDLHL